MLVRVGTTRRVRVVVGTILLGVAPLVALLWILIPTATTPNGTEQLANDFADFNAGELENPLTVLNSTLAQADGIRTSGLDSLKRSCPGTFLEWTSECFQVLDQYFLGKPLDFIRIIEPVERQMWRDVLDDVDSDKQTVQDVFGDPLCRVEEGDIRSDLYDACHAETLASYAMFRSDCARTDLAVMPLQEDFNDFEFRRSLPDYLSVLERQSSLTVEVYREFRAEHEERYFFGGWLLNKCNSLLADHAPPVLSEKLDFSSIQLSSVHLEEIDDPEQLKEIYQAGLQAGLYRGDDPEAFGYIHEVFSNQEADALIDLAARLGHEWAQTVYRGNERYMEALRKESPLVWHMWKATPDGRTDARVRTRNAAIVEQLARKQNRTVYLEELYSVSRDEGLIMLSSEETESAKREGAAEYDRLYGSAQ